VDQQNESSNLNSDVNLQVAESGLIPLDQPAALEADILKQLEAPKVINPFRERMLTSFVDISGIVNLGKLFFDVIRRNQPVINVRYDYANALPKGVSDASMMGNFSNLQVRSFRAFAKNIYGMTLYDVMYSVVHQYWGSYQGKGKYLHTVTVLPHTIRAVTGYTVDMTVGEVAAINAGTAEEPVASLTMSMHFRAYSIFHRLEVNDVFQFRGDSEQVTYKHKLP